MGVDLRLQIPSHVSFELVADFLGQFFCDPTFVKQSSNSSVNLEAPSSKENSWHYSYDKLKNTVMVGMLQLNFSAWGKVDKMWSFHYDNYATERQFLGFKLASPKANALNVAAAQKLVETFGGWLQYADSSDTYDLQVKNKDALFPKEKFVAEDADTVYFRRINFISQVKPMSLSDLQFGIEHSSYGITQEDLQEYTALIVQHEKKKLENQIAPVKARTTKDNTKVLKI